MVDGERRSRAGMKAPLQINCVGARLHARPEVIAINLVICTERQFSWHTLVRAALVSQGNCVW
jgi:hypothetical protein